MQSSKRLWDNDDEDDDNDSNNIDNNNNNDNDNNDNYNNDYNNILFILPFDTVQLLYNMFKSSFQLLFNQNIAILYCTISINCVQKRITIS